MGVTKLQKWEKNENSIFDEKSEKWMRIDWQHHGNQGIKMRGRDVAINIKDGVRGRPWGPPNWVKWHKPIAQI